MAAALALGVGLAFADSSIVVLALPELYAEFDASVVDVSWVITAYNAAVAVVVLALVPVAVRVRAAPLAAVGLVVFGAASVVCAVAGGLPTLVGARAAQGVGAALLLAASLPLLVAAAGAAGRAVAVWVGAATLGTAAGPALGGVLTRAFDWRAIFAVQAPVAAVALAAALHPVARTALPAPDERPRRPPVAAAAGLAFAFASLVGALFLSVLLLVTVWGLGPLAGAAAVSVLPLSALAVRPLSGSLGPREDVAAGAALLAAGLAALALLPASSTVYAVPALALAGAGLGLALPPLTHASLPRGERVRAAAWSVGIRHVGLVSGLVAVAPLLARDLDAGVERATRNATAVVLEAPVPITHKVPLALDLYRLFEEAREGEVPDLARPFDERIGRTARIEEVRDDLLEAVEAALTRSFRGSFALCALFALLAALGLAGARSRQGA